MISAHQFAEEYNTFAIEIIFRRAVDILFTHHIKELRIVYLWPNHYYQVDEEEVIHTLSRVSLDTGVTSSEGSTYIPPSPSPPLIESLVQPNHSASELPIPQQQSELSTSSNIPRLIDADLTVELVLACIHSGIDLDEVSFTHGNITFCHLQQIDHNENPQFYPESYDAVDDQYKQQWKDEIESQVEEEVEEEAAKGQEPLQIPDPSGTHSRIPESELSSAKQSPKLTRYRLERHLGTIIEEMF